MTQTSPKRQRLIDAAGALIHQQGYAQTTLADIAKDADVPLGNVYYYFKTKDELGSAVILQRKTGFMNTLNEWENTEPDPRQRLRLMLEMILGMKDIVAAHGCPIGSLCQELDKQNSSLSALADKLIQDQLQWTIRQYQQLGSKNAEQDGQALVSAVHGISLVCHAMKDPNIMLSQITLLKSQLENH